MNAVRTAAGALVLAGVLAACGGSPAAPAGPSGPAGPSAGPVAADVPVVAAPLGRAQPELPTSRSRPKYLHRSYRAPEGGSVSSRGVTRAGTLRIPSLRIVAPIDAVGLDRGVMAIPNSPARIGWLRTTATATDRIGASVLSGHVSDSRDAPGALSRLRTIRRGAVISWTTPRGSRHTFVVTGTKRYPRTRGVPAQLFGVVGPHVLHLITCADRVTTGGGGFHYTNNLVVTAREVTD